MGLLVQFEPPTLRIEFDMKLLIDFGKLFFKVTLNCLERPFLVVWERQRDSTQLFSRWSGFLNKISKGADISDQLEIVAHMGWLLK